MIAQDHDEPQEVPTMTDDKPRVDSVTREDAAAVAVAAARSLHAVAAGARQHRTTDHADVMITEHKSKQLQAALTVLAVMDTGQAAHAYATEVSRQAVHERYRRALAIVADEAEYARAAMEAQSP